MNPFRRLQPLLLTAAAFVVALGLPASSTGQASDPSPPVITPSIIGTLGDDGWYRSSVTVGWTVVDPESGVTDEDNCDTWTRSQDTTGVSSTCRAENGAGMTGSYTVVVKVDKTAPTVSAALTRAADFDGWYTGAVTAVFNGTDQTSRIASCTAPVTYAGPDTTGTEIAGSCRDRAGNQASASVEVKYDATAPVVKRIVPSRPPARYGWFNRPIQFVLHGEDATSGIGSCDAPRYAGPNAAPASVSGTCRDRAGNVSPERTATFKYARPLLLPKHGSNVTGPVFLRWVEVERARYYNVQVWRGQKKVRSVWPRDTSYRLGRRWTYKGERYTLKPGRRYRWYVWPRLGSRYGRLLGASVFDVRRVRSPTASVDAVTLR